MPKHDLILIGEFGMLELSVPSPPLHQKRGTMSSEHKAMILDYLRAGARFAFSSPIEERFLGPLGYARERALRTDGTFAWPNYLPYYVEHHDADLPSDFIAHVEQRSGNAPLDVDLSNLMLLGSGLRPFSKPSLYCERMLGYELSPDLAWSVPTLNDLTDSLLAEVKRLITKSLAVHEYLQYVVVWSNLHHVSDFLNEVLKGGADHRTWCVRDVFCISRFDLRTAATQSVRDLIKPLEQVAGERWWQLEPVIQGNESWSESCWWSESCGAPGVLVRQVPYWWSGPPSTEWTSSHHPLRKIDLNDVHIRRWIASRLADALRGRHYEASVASVCATIGVEETQLSSDMRIAIKGLLREQEAAMPSSAVVPGFRGPDDWYQ